ncbi:MAG: putative transcriptional regulator [Candidatus Paceibacteria bacterium]|jgi:predicted transcriptional regulator
MSVPSPKREKANSPEDPTAAEWKVLRVIWDTGPIAARDVLSALEDETGWSASTVKTLLRRLAEKGHLRTQRVGNSFLYSAQRSPLGPLRRAADLLMERAGGDRLGQVLAYLVKQSNLTDTDIDELRDLIGRKDTEDEA